MGSISFFKLPLLVQSKILREYVPVFQKVFTLSLIPEFEDLLRSKHFWLNSSKELFNFYDLLRSFKPGLYICFEEAWLEQGCIVSITDTTILFEFCCFHKCKSNPLKPDFDKFSNVWVCHFKESLLKTTAFLTTFLKYYIYFDEKNLNIYKFYRNYIFVNRLTNNLYWLDGSIHRLKNNGCIISDKIHPDHFFVLVDNDVMYIECIAMCERLPSFRCLCSETCRYFEPIKIEPFSIDPKKNKFEFQMVDNNEYVLLNILMLNDVCLSFKPELFENSFRGVLSLWEEFYHYP